MLAGSLQAPLALTAASDTPWPITVRAALARLAQVEFSLRRAAGSRCPRQDSAIGAKFDYIAAYEPAQQPLVRQTTGLGDAPQVIAVAQGSPAARAGLAPGDEIISINGLVISPSVSYGGPQGLMPDFIEDMIARTPIGEDVVIMAARAGVPRALHITAEQLCATRFYLKTGEGMRAYSDERSVAIGNGFMNFARNDDELAVIAGHELAHVVAGDRKTRSLARRRAMEDRADLLGAALARCAGYDVRNGSQIWSRFDDRDWQRWGKAWTHRKPSDRASRIADYAARAPVACHAQVPDLILDR